MFNFFLLMHSSLRNFVYRGICLIASNNGMLTSTFQQVYKISCFDSSFLAFANFPGNGVTKFLVIGKMGLPLNFILGESKIVGSVSSLLFLVSADSGVAIGSIFVADSVVESDVAASSMVCTTVAGNPGIIAGWVVCTIVVAESGVAIGGIFPAESGFAAGNTFAVDSGVEIGSIFAADSGVAAGNMVYTSFPLLRVMALAFYLGLISS
ncbi:hypothetical protein Peur_069663 [Populus x canadensis]